MSGIYGTLGTPKLRRALALALILHNDYRTHSDLKRIIVEQIRLLEAEIKIPPALSSLQEIRDE